MYFLIGPEPGLVISTGPTGTPPIQLPVGVTAGGAELFELDDLLALEAEVHRARVRERHEPRGDEAVPRRC